MAWTSEIESLDGARARKLTLFGDGSALSYAEVIENWRQDEEFNAYFSDLLAAMPFAAFFWETPPVTAYTTARAFECVVIGSPALARLEAEPAAFARPFAVEPEDEVVTFENLGGDAWLVAPRPVPEAEGYPQLAAFLRAAPASQRSNLWSQTGEALIRLLSERPLWVSTSGLGVAWVHVRLDTWPKYHVHKPYRSFA